MNHANALRGTLMGRKVKTEEEVLKEMANLDHDAGDSVIPIVGSDTADTSQESRSPVDTSNQDPQSETAKPDMGDVFQFERFIETHAGDFELYGLVTEEGRWEHVKLSTNPNFTQAKLTWREWVAFSNGHGGIIDGIYAPTGLFHSDCRLAPMKSIYWFMRAGYEIWTNLQKNKQAVCPDSIENLRYFLGLISETRFYHADSIEKVGNKIYHAYHGWGGQYFGSYGVRFPESWQHSQYILSPKQPVQELLGAVVGDRNINRVASVFDWVCKTPLVLAPIILMPETLEGSFNSVAYGCNPLERRLVTNHPLDARGPAHMVQLDDSDFTPARKP